MMLINLRNALMAGKRLPYDAEVEFLESTGGQYINTGIIGGSSSKVEISASSSNTAQNMGLFGSRNTSLVKAFTIWQRVTNTSVRFDFADNTTNRAIANAAWDTSGVNTVIKDGPNNTLNGVAGANNATATFTCEYPFYLFSINTSGTATSNASARVYSCKIWQNGVLVRDYIPVRKGTVGYLYDRVSGRLFGNAGTGDFVLGPDVVPVEYIESHGTEWIDTGFIPGLNFHIEVRGRKAGDYSVNAAIFSNEGVNSYVDCYYNADWGMRCYGNGMARQIYDGWFDAGIDFDFTSSPTTTFHMNSEEETATTSKTEAQITGSTKSVRLFQGMYGKKNPVDIVFFNADKNGQPALRLSAVRVGTEGAMIDVLTRRVYRNAGTGAFTYGNDLKYPIPAE